MGDLEIHENRRDDHLGMAVIMMGVSGAGKTTIGRRLSEQFQCSFFDADDFHSKENKEKMRGAIPLSDEDRQPWLEALRELLRDRVLAGQTVVLACSALRRKYRDFLRTANPMSPKVQTVFVQDIGSSLKPPAGSVIFVYLSGSYELFMSRLEARYKEGTHYMPPSLLHSQIDALELDKNEPGIVHVDASMPPAMIVKEVGEKLLDKQCKPSYRA